MPLPFVNSPVLTRRMGEKCSSGGVLIGLAILCILVGCGIPKDDKKEAPRIEAVSKIMEGDNDIISFHETYRFSDQPFVRLIESIPEIDGFTPINVLDYQNYPQNVVGVTDKENNKEEILNELVRLESLPENSFFCWSKWKQENEITHKHFYYLYLLKEMNKKLKIRSEDILKAEVNFNKSTNETAIRIKFNDAGTEKWSEITEKAAFNNRNHLAVVVDSEVYFCPTIMSPIYSGDAVILGFEDENEAKKIAARINSEK